MEPGVGPATGPASGGGDEAPRGPGDPVPPSVGLQAGAGAEAVSSCLPTATPNVFLHPSVTRVLYWGSGSPPAWRVFIALMEKGISFHAELMSFESGILRSSAYKALNPRCMVPVFVDNGAVLYESLAILHYLEHQYPEVKLLPDDPIARARALMRIDEANNCSTAAGEVVYYLRRTPPSAVNVEYLHSKTRALHDELKLWESYLEDSEFLAGKGVGVTLADCSFFPNLAYMVRLGLKLPHCYPNLHAYFERMARRKSVLASWPPHWKGNAGMKLLSTPCPCPSGMCK